MMLVDEDAGKPGSRLISLVLTIAYVMIAFKSAGAEAALRLSLYCLVPLGCIWFPDVMGDYTDFGLGTGTGITKTSPPGFVRFLGWVVLLLPIVIALILWLADVRTLA
jgi:hypothetical protein